MAEPDARTLRRLKTLEGRLARSTAQAKALVAERRELVHRLTTAERAAARLEAEAAALREAREAAEAALRETREETEAALREARAAADAERRELTDRLREAEERAKEAEGRTELLPDQVTALVEENRRLAEQLQDALADVQTFASTADEAKKAAETAAAEAKAAAENLRRLESFNQALTDERDALVKQVSIAQVQLKSEGKTPILPPDTAAKLVGDLVDRFRSGVSGLTVRDGELRLRVAFGAVGDEAGFVLPTADSGPEIKDALQELTLRLDRANEPASPSLARSPAPT